MESEFACMTSCSSSTNAGKDMPVHLLPTQYRAAVALEQALGDPAQPANTLSSRRIMALDETESFPEDAVALLHAMGLPKAYVPRALGGEFESSETALALGRVISRRDMTVSVSYSTLLWSALAWIGGDGRQRQEVAEWVVMQGRFPCLAYSEAGHGADLLANELTARRTPEGDYILNGEKWPINRATRSGFLVLLARTDGAHSQRNHTLFIVDKAGLPDQAYYHLPKVKTHGLRGCDISGIGFRDCPVPASARVGLEGHGLELALKGFQLTRTFCTSLSLGVGDSALRLVADFAADRRIYGTTVDRLPHARDVLANAYLSQLMAEAVAIVSARGLHLHPGRFSTWSSVAKVGVTHLVDQATHQLATVFGARHYLREQHGEGMFQKLLRDGAIVAVFDGSSVVCLDSLATLLPLLVRNRRRGIHAQAQRADAVALFDLRQSLPPLSFDRFELSGRGRDPVMECLPGLVGQLRDLRPDPVCDADTLAALCASAARLSAQLAELDAQVLEEAAIGQRNSARQFGFAQRYVELHAAVSALGLWLHNRTTLGDFFQAGQWVLAALQRSTSALQYGALPPALAHALHAQLDLQRSQGLMFSLLHWPLAPAGSLECPSPFFEGTTP
jgi:alkylation response protein AidB-like acyl-CoA dehydrogenase